MKRHTISQLGKSTRSKSPLKRELTKEQKVARYKEKAYNASAERMGVKRANKGTNPNQGKKSYS